MYMYKDPNIFTGSVPAAWWTFSMRDKVEISGIPTLTRSLITTVHDTILIRFHNKKYLITKNIWSQNTRAAAAGAEYI